MDELKLSLLARIETATSEEEIVALKEELALAFTMGNFSLGCGNRLQNKLLSRIEDGDIPSDRKSSLKDEVITDIGIELD